MIRSAQQANTIPPSTRQVESWNKSVSLSAPVFYMVITVAGMRGKANNGITTAVRGTEALPTHRGGKPGTEQIYREK